jgi:hypothetical protein
MQVYNETRIWLSYFQTDNDKTGANYRIVITLLLRERSEELEAQPDVVLGE